MTPDRFDYGAAGREYWISERGEIARYLVTSNLADLRRFLDEVEDFVDRAESSEVEDIRRRFGPNVEWAEHYPVHWQDVIGAQLRQAFIVSLMSATEWHTTLMYEATRALLQVQRAPGRRPRGTLGRSRQYLTRVAHYATPAADVWNSMESLYLVRSILVHNAAMLDRSRERANVTQFIGTAPGIDAQSGFLTIRKEFCVFAHSRVEEFFAGLHRGFVDLCQRLEAAG